MKEGLSVEKGKVNGGGRFKMVGTRLKGKGRVRKGEGVSIVKGVEGVHPISLPGVKKLLHNINSHRYCVPKTIKLFGFPIF
jgi:hypothetical protein